MTSAIYAFSGDPITYGHIDIIERASKVFNEVVVGIGINPSKKYLFDLEERTLMAKKSLSKFSNVNVVSFDGLLVDYAYENNIPVIIKGVRNSVDFDYENMLDQVGNSQKLGIDTYILFAKPELAHISSSIVKAVQKEQGMINHYVPLYVKQCLEERICGQYIVGITGEIGSGKSYVGRRFVEFGKKNGIKVHNIELDDIAHQILTNLKNPKYDSVRFHITNAFGKGVQKQDGSIDRKALGELVFTDSSNLAKLNDIMKTPILVRLRRELYGKRGLILLNSALIFESEMSYLCNNNVVLIYVDKKTQKLRLSMRGMDDAQMQRRLRCQFDFYGKKKSLEKAIEKDDNGHLFMLDNANNRDESHVLDMYSVFDAVVDKLLGKRRVRKDVNL